VYYGNTSKQNNNNNNNNNKPKTLNHDTDTVKLETTTNLQMHMRSLSCGFGWWLNFDTKKTSCHRFLPTVSENGMFWCIPVSFLSSAGSANSITGQKLSVDRISRVSVYLSVCVCMYTRIAQIITDSHRPCNSACADLLMNSDHIQKKLDCESKKHAVHIVR